MPELEPGDFLYQSDQELFLCVIGETDDSYLFAAHGWRDIGKDRVEHYLEDDRSKVHSQSEIEKLVEENGDDEEIAKFEELTELFTSYEDADIDMDGLASEFAFEE